ncbi:hypothetical protein [Porphyromonas levii]|uniref:hypothetical protein n=1 Tax=Porphyromonas levii TaxID=28114 RepID=UPI00036F98E2|nr:hypothetical protein [Porphyromonas levii]
MVMTEIELRRKFKFNMNKPELQAVLRMILWYIYSRDTSYNDIVELANVQRAIKLGQRLTNRIHSTEKSRCKFTLNIQEAGTMYVILECLPHQELQPLEGVVVRRMYEVITK